MRRLILLTLQIIIVTAACKKNTAVDNQIPCLERRINYFKEVACEKGANVKEYLFLGDTVYVLNPGTCGADMISTVIDQDCNAIGELGGITGNTKVKGTEFSVATLIKTLWHN
jgi:hypothetical protein